MPDSLSLLPTHILVPILFAVWMAKGKHRSQAEWTLELAAFASYIAFVFFTGRWGMASVYLRYLSPILLVIVAFRSGRRLSELPRFVSLRKIEVLRTCFLSFILCLTLPLLVITLVSLPKPNRVKEVEFPFRNAGMFYVADGGPHVLLNRRADRAATVYATLFQRIDALGRVRSGPSGQAEQAEQAERLDVFSPVAGVVGDSDFVADSGTGVDSATGGGAVASYDTGLSLTIVCPDSSRVVLEGLGGSSRSVGDVVDAGGILGWVAVDSLAGMGGLWVYAHTLASDSLVAESMVDSLGQIAVPLSFSGTYLMRNYLYRSGR